MRTHRVRLIDATDPTIRRAACYGDGSATWQPLTLVQLPLSPLPRCFDDCSNEEGSCDTSLCTLAGLLVKPEDEVSGIPSV